MSAIKIFFQPSISIYTFYNKFIHEPRHLPRWLYIFQIKLSEAAREPFKGDAVGQQVFDLWVYETTKEELGKK